MFYNSFKFMGPTCVAWILLAGAGFAQPSKVESVATNAPVQTKTEGVAQTLQTYQVGKTTIMNFIKDAGLVNATFPSPYDPGPNPTIGFFLKSTYKTPTNSAWMIYETGYETSSRGFDLTRTRKYVVGDTNAPICILDFDKEGKLASISDVPNLSAKPPSKGRLTPARSSQNVRTVARTLKRYRVGETTFEDFVRDAHLIQGPAFSRTYLTPTPPPFFQAALGAPAEGPWKIYNISFSQINSTNGEAGGLTKREYLVGDTNKPICTLIFDQTGRLTSISPAR